MNGNINGRFQKANFLPSSQLKKVEEKAEEKKEHLESNGEEERKLSKQPELKKFDVDAFELIAENNKVGMKIDLERVLNHESTPKDGSSEDVVDPEEPAAGRAVNGFEDDEDDQVDGDKKYAKGDVNHDGVVDVADISAVINAMAEDGTNTQYDVNGDGSVDIADISAVNNIMANGDDDIDEAGLIEEQELYSDLPTALSGAIESFQNGELSYDNFYSVLIKYVQALDFQGEQGVVSGTNTSFKSAENPNRITKIIINDEKVTIEFIYDNKTYTVSGNKSADNTAIKTEFPLSENDIDSLNIGISSDAFYEIINKYFSKTTFDNQTFYAIKFGTIDSVKNLIQEMYVAEKINSNDYSELNDIPVDEFGGFALIDSNVYEDRKANYLYAEYLRGSLISGDEFETGNVDWELAKSCGVYPFENVFSDYLKVDEVRYALGYYGINVPNPSDTEAFNQFIEENQELWDKLARATAIGEDGSYTGEYNKINVLKYFVMAKTDPIVMDYVERLSANSESMNTIGQGIEEEPRVVVDYEAIENYVKTYSNILTEDQISDISMMTALYLDGVNDLSNLKTCVDMAVELIKEANAKGVNEIDYVSVRLVDFVEMKVANQNMTLDEMNTQLAVNNFDNLMLNSINSIYSDTFGEEVQSFQDLVELQMFALMGCDYDPELRSAYVNSRSIIYLTLAQNGEITNQQYYESIVNDLANLFPLSINMSEEESNELISKIKTISPEKILELTNKTLELPTTDDEDYQAKYDKFLQEFNSAVSNINYSVSNSEAIMDINSVYLQRFKVEFNADNIIKSANLIEETNQKIEQTAVYMALQNLNEKVQNGDVTVGDALFQIGYLYTGSTNSNDIIDFIKTISGYEDIKISNGTVIIGENAASSRAMRAPSNNGNSKEQSCWNSIINFCTDSFNSIADSVDSAISSVAETLSDPNTYKAFGGNCMTCAGALGLSGLAAYATSPGTTIGGVAAGTLLEFGAAVAGVVGGISKGIGATIEFYQKLNCSAAQDIYGNIEWNDFSKEALTNYSKDMTFATIEAGLSSLGIPKVGNAVFGGIGKIITNTMNRIANRYNNTMPILKENPKLIEYYNRVGYDDLTCTNKLVKFAGMDGQFSHVGYKSFNTALQEIPENSYLWDLLWNTDAPATAKLLKTFDDYVAGIKPTTFSEKIEALDQFMFDLVKGKRYDKVFNYPLGTTYGDAFAGSLYSAERTVCRHRAMLALALAERMGICGKSACGRGHAWLELFDETGKIIPRDYMNHILTKGRLGENYIEEITNASYEYVGRLTLEDFCNDMKNIPYYVIDYVKTGGVNYSQIFNDVFTTAAIVLMMNSTTSNNNWNTSSTPGTYHTTTHPDGSVTISGSVSNPMASSSGNAFSTNGYRNSGSSSFNNTAMNNAAIDAAVAQLTAQLQGQGLSTASVSWNYNAQGDIQFNVNVPNGIDIQPTINQVMNDFDIITEMKELIKCNYAPVFNGKGGGYGKEGFMQALSSGNFYNKDGTLDFQAILENANAVGLGGNILFGGDTEVDGIKYQEITIINEDDGSITKIRLGVNGDDKLCVIDTYPNDMAYFMQECFDENGNLKNYHPLMNVLPASISNGIAALNLDSNAVNNYLSNIFESMKAFDNLGSALKALNGYAAYNNGSTFDGDSLKILANGLNSDPNALNQFAELLNGFASNLATQKAQTETKTNFNKWKHSAVLNALGMGGMNRGATSIYGGFNWNTFNWDSFFIDFPELEQDIMDEYWMLILCSGGDGVEKRRSLKEQMMLQYSAGIGVECYLASMGSTEVTAYANQSITLTAPDWFKQALKKGEIDWYATASPDDAVEGSMTAKLIEDYDKYSAWQEHNPQVKELDMTSSYLLYQYDMMNFASWQVFDALLLGIDSNLSFEEKYDAYMRTNIYNTFVNEFVEQLSQNMNTKMKFLGSINDIKRQFIEGKISEEEFYSQIELKFKEINT